MEKSISQKGEKTKANKKSESNEEIDKREKKNENKEESNKRKKESGMRLEKAPCEQRRSIPHKLSHTALLVPSAGSIRKRQIKLYRKYPLRMEPVECDSKPMTWNNLP
jgi:hypothetical protein